MPLDPTISLQGKPVAIETPDITKTFLTLGQLRYLNAEAARTQAQAQAAQAAEARTQGLFTQQTAAGQLLSDLRSGGPAPAAAPGSPTPGLPPPATTGSAPVSPAQQPQPVDPLSPEGQAAIYRVAPNAGGEIIKGLYEFQGQKLAQQKQAFEDASAKIGVVRQLIGATTDQQSLDMNLGLLKQAGIDVSKIPPQWTPDLPVKIGETGRTAQQRIEEAQKNFEQQTQRLQAQAATQQAKTAQQLADRGYPLGTGYGQDPGAPPPRIIGPQGNATQAPISPEGMALKNGYTQRFETGSQDFKASTAAYNEVVPALKQETNTGDLVALRAFSKLSLPSQAVRGAGSNAPLGNIMELVEGEITRLATDKGATIAAPLRKKLLETAKVLHAQQIDTHLQFRDQVRDEATKQLGPAAALEVAPNRITTYGSGGRAMSQETFTTYLKAHPGLTRGQAVLDLAEKGFTVRGGPQ